MQSERQLSPKETLVGATWATAFGTQRTLNERAYKDKIQYTSQKKGLGAMSGKFRNFDLTVDEIKIVRMIKELIKNLERLSFDDPQSPRAEFFRKEIDTLEEKLEEIRENTLIR